VRKDWKYITYLSLAVAFYLVIKMAGPREFDWTVTFHHEDKNPFGAYVLNEVMNDVFHEDDINRSTYTIYELFDTLKAPVNFVSISSRFSAGEQDAVALLKNVSNGGDAFIAAQSFYNTLADTLSISTSDYFFDNALESMFDKKDTSKVAFKSPSLAGEEYYYPRKNVHNYFDDFDTTRTSIIAANDLGLPVLIRTKWGKGNLYLCSIPMAFTNAYLLDGDNNEFAEKALSYLPERNLQWTAFYHLGRMEIQTPLRFILTTEPLTWAYYIAIALLLLFMIFEAKRRQRIIPVVKPLKNSSLEFVTTIGNLYFQNADHKNIAEKKIIFLYEQIRSKFFMTTNIVDEDFFKTLSKKSGHSLDEIRSLFEKISAIRNRDRISGDDLIDLNKRIEKFTI
jgi:hypothetical protein